MFIFILILLGLCFGSFINALVWRIHKQSKAQSPKAKAQYSMLHGRSMCVHCRHTLAWYDLLPLVSWLSLKGKCRYCHKPISAQYPLVEVLTAALFVVSYIFFPYHLSDIINQALFVFWLVFLVGFVALAVYDLRWMILPNNLVFPLLLLAGLQVVLETVFRQDFNVFVSAVWGLLAVGGLFYILFQVSKGKWIGGGDVKLGFMLGLLAGGFVEGLMVVFLASLLGTIAMLPSVIAQKQNLQRRIPFGPFLIVATIIVYLMSSDMMSWYQTQLLQV